MASVVVFGSIRVADIIFKLLVVCNQRSSKRWMKVKKRLGSVANMLTGFLLTKSLLAKQLVPLESPV